VYGLRTHKLEVSKVIYIKDLDAIIFTCNIYEIQLAHMYYNLHKDVFCNRNIAVWNSLRNTLVSVEYVDIYIESHLIFK
jgi:hypothetical protein